MLFISILWMQFSPVGHYFASCSHDRTARIWSMDRIQPLRIMAGHLSDVDVSYNIRHPLCCLFQFSPDVAHVIFYLHTSEVHMPVI